MSYRFAVGVLLAGSLGLGMGLPAMAAPVSVQALYQQVPAVPGSAAEALRVVTADGEIGAANWLRLRQQLQQAREQLELRASQVAADTQSSMTDGAGIDVARMQSDPDYAERMQQQMEREAERLQRLPPAQQMAEAMKMQQRFQQQALQDVRKKAQESPAVEAATTAFHQRMTALAADTQLQMGWAARIDAIKQRTEQQQDQLLRTASRRLRCSDGEGGCATAADEAHDRTLARETWRNVTPLYDRALQDIAVVSGEISSQRASVVREGHARLSATGYGTAAHSDSSAQLIGQYHGMMLSEIEALLQVSEDAALWAAGRLQQRTLFGHAL